MVKVIIKRIIILVLIFYANNIFCMENADDLPTDSLQLLEKQLGLMAENLTGLGAALEQLRQAIPSSSESFEFEDGESTDHGAVEKFKNMMSLLEKSLKEEEVTREDKQGNSYQVAIKVSSLTDQEVTIIRNFLMKGFNTTTAKSFENTENDDNEIKAAVLFINELVKIKSEKNFNKLKNLGKIFYGWPLFKNVNALKKKLGFNEKDDIDKEADKLADEMNKVDKNKTAKSASSNGVGNNQDEINHKLLIRRKNLPRKRKNNKDEQQEEDALRKQQEEVLRKQQEEVLRKQQEEVLRKQQEEDALRKQQEEVLRKQQENDDNNNNEDQDDEEKSSREKNAQAEAEDIVLINKIITMLNTNNYATNGSNDNGLMTWANAAGFYIYANEPYYFKYWGNENTPVASKPDSHSVIISSLKVSIDSSKNNSDSSDFLNIWDHFDSDDDKESSESKSEESRLIQIIESFSILKQLWNDVPWANKTTWGNVVLREPLENKDKITAVIKKAQIVNNLLKDPRITRNLGEFIHHLELLPGQKKDPATTK